MDRRNFIKNLGLGTLAASVATASTIKSVSADTPPVYDIVVVGGGFGGASAAKYVALWGAGNVNVTLIDSNPSHVSCILSNLVLNGQKTLSNLTFNLSQSATKHNFTFKQGTLSSIGTTTNGNRCVILATGETVVFDKLILAPGIDFDYPPGMEGWTDDSTTPFPHAWKAGLQTNNLRDQLKKLPSGGNARVVMTIPAKPYRCPPGPYERACLIADYLKTKKGGGKLYVLDANPYIQAEPTSFSFAFAEMYKGIIEYHPNTTINSVFASGAFNPALTTLPKDKTINVTYNATPAPPNPLPHKMPLTAVTQIKTTDKFHLINVIPNQKAADFLFKTEFNYLRIEKYVDTIPVYKNWVPVYLDSYLSKNDKDIYILGDAHDSIQPKAGHIANSEAKVCADALLSALNLRPARVMPDEAPVTNSACFSPITATTASFLTTGFRYVEGNPGNVVKILEASGEAEQISSDNYKMMLAWANNLFAEVF